MATRSPITGDEIKSKPSTKAWNDNYDKIFAKKTAHEWLVAEDITLLDSEGWQDEDGWVTLDTPISYKEFQSRLSKSTIISKIPK